MFGIGDLFNGGYGRSAAMGGVSSPLFSMYNLNPSNPASYMAVAPSTFVFEVGLAGNWYNLKNPGNSFKKFDGNVRSISIGFPVTKWWKMGVGVLPVSSIGYNIEQNGLLENDTTRLTSIYKGEGGINSFYADNSFKILKSLSVGVKVSYLFGSIDRIRELHSYNSISTSYYYESNRWFLSKLTFGFGAHFHKSFSSDFQLNIGANYNFKTDLGAEYTRFAINRTVKFQVAKTDTIDLPTNGSSLKMPSGFAIGASALLFQKLEFAVDYQNDNWSDVSFDQQTFADNKKYCMGLEFIPDAESSVYWKFIRYRAGFSLTNSYLMQENEQLKQLNGSFGFGFPIKSGALIDVGFIYSHRSAPKLDLLTENYFQINLNFSFKANWFIKTKFY
jgi:hypothetical protein